MYINAFPIINKYFSKKSYRKLLKKLICLLEESIYSY
ncbi:hypothetical protein NEOC95_001475 [Neochlamydia sp. AcF95]|nr:hypothetical protein [Neochlamydia sp. AcF95]